MDKFEWQAGDSGPEDHPMEILRGDFIFPEEGSLYIPTHAGIQHGWGRPVSSHLVGSRLKPLPNRLEILYFSYLENAFYQGDFELPYEKILALFQNSYHSIKFQEEVSLRVIVVGVAPGGAVSVWLRGVDKQVEVFFGKAEKVDADWNLVYKLDEFTREEFVQRVLENALKPEVLASFEKNGVDFAQWDKFRQRYHWTPLLNIPNPLNYIRQLTYFNGELNYMAYPLSEVEKNKTRVVPETLYIIWKSPQGLILSLTYRFDEDEIFNAFETLAPTVNGISSTHVQLEIRIEVNDEGKNEYSAFLRNDKEAIKLKKTDLELLRSGVTESQLKAFY